MYSNIFSTGHFCHQETRASTTTLPRASSLLLQRPVATSWQAVGMWAMQTWICRQNWSTTRVPLRQQTPKRRRWPPRPGDSPLATTGLNSRVWWPTMSPPVHSSRRLGELAKNIYLIFRVNFCATWLSSVVVFSVWKPEIGIRPAPYFFFFYW